MSETARPGSARNPWLSWAAWRGLFRDRPIIPLLGLLGLLVVVIQLVRPGMVNPEWAGVILRAAVILAILAGCQTLTMLTGGSASRSAVASMAGFVTATLVGSSGLPVAIAVASPWPLSPLCRRHRGPVPRSPADHDLGMSLVVWASPTCGGRVVQTGAGFRPVPVARIGLSAASCPTASSSSVPLAALILSPCGAPGTAGCSTRSATTRSRRASRALAPAGARAYVISALMAAVAGLLLAGLTNVASVTLADSLVLPSVAAAVIGGTSIFGGRGGFGGTIVGALILTVISALLTALGFPEAVRQILFGAIIVVVAATYARVTGEA
jgi:ribose transport system permease protein